MTKWLLAFLVVALVAPVVAVAQSAVPDLPDFLLPFASGHWWVIPAFGLVFTVLSYADIFLRENGGIKDSWPPLARKVWDIFTANVLHSKSAPTPPKDNGA